MKQILALCFAAMTFFFLGHQTIAAERNPCFGEYPKEPPFLSENAKPSTTLLVDFSGSLNEHAYQEKAVQWETSTTNATAYTGYDATFEYYGYFGHDIHYKYESSKFVNATKGSDTWRGNFLNWVSMHRIDIMRKAMTGGAYDSVDGTYTVSKTDGLNGRGKYHVFNSTGTDDIPTNLRDKILGFEQGSADHTIKIFQMDKTSSSPETYKPTTEPVLYQLTVQSEQELGAIHLMAPSTRLALFTFDDSNPAEGGKALVYMTDNATEVIDKINSIDVHSTTSMSPISEALYTVIGYIQNATDTPDAPPRYNGDDSYIVSKETDPYYFDQYKTAIPCTQQNIIIISDGIPSEDKNIPSKFLYNDYDKSGNDVTPAVDGMALDNIAYWAHTTDLRPDFVGDQTVNIYTIALYSANSTLLKEAAEWGGFIEESERTDKNGVPYTFFDISNSTAGRSLEDALTISMSGSTSKASAGGSASVVSTSRKGEGLLYQAIFWPRLTDTKGNSVSWAGDVYAYWLDDAGLLYEDDGDVNATLDPNDSRITLWYDDSDPTNKRTRACSNGTVIDGECVNGTVKEIRDVSHVWSAAKELNSISKNDITTKSAYKTKDRRFITTWISNKDGIVQSNNATHDSDYNHFHPDNTELSKLLDAKTINWIRGLDQSGMRSRTLHDDTTNTNSTWRLGDVINSSPTVVGPPAENYHLYWGDSSYLTFYQKYRNRRIMSYFGANDGMLHAVNSGFYNEQDKRYYKTADFTINTDAMELGAEMWAYVPYNLLPHLECLTKDGYLHQYYVDLKPRVFDVKAFTPSAKHPGGWGTILVGGFNFGGDGKQELEYKNRLFGSSYFIFDVTDPEEEPVFLGEMTFDGTFTLGFSINTPTVVATTDGTKTDGAPNTFWYLLFGNGPEHISGTTTQGPLAVVVPLKTLIQNNSTFKFRPTDKTGNPSETNMGLIKFGQTLGGSKFYACISTGFVSIDYDNNYFVDMMYYGLVTTESKAPFRKGGMHRLKVENKDPSKWAVMKMTETDFPITGTPNAALKDALGKTGSIWVYFGSGIFWDVGDKSITDQNWIYGIEEPKKAGSYNFSVIHEKSLYDVTGIGVNSTDGIGTLYCEPKMTCNIPSGVKTVEELGDYIQNTSNIDGWKRKLAERERVLGQPTVFGGLTNFTTYTPASDLCSSEGSSKLYALYYRTGTAWKEDVFGTGAGDYIINIGPGMSVTPSLHLGSEEGVRAYLQTSTGSIIEIHQPNLPVSNVKSGMGGWHTINVD